MKKRRCKENWKMWKKMYRKEGVEKRKYGKEVVYKRKCGEKRII